MRRIDTIGTPFVAFLLALLLLFLAYQNSKLKETNPAVDNPAVEMALP